MRLLTTAAEGLREMRTYFLLIFFLIFYCQAYAYHQDNIVPPVVISPDKIPTGNVSQGPKTIITQKELSKKGATSLAQALQELGEVQLQDITGNGSQVSISMRGFGVNASSNTLLLINGIPITNPDLAPPDLNAIPLNEIEHIEITSGTETVLYGDQAVGGIINIITNKEEANKINLACSGGSYNQSNCYATLNKHIKNLNIRLGGLTTHNDNYREHNEYNQTLVSGGLDYLYSKGRMDLDYQIANERMLYPGALTAKQVRENRRQSTNHNDFFRDWNGFYHLKNQHQWNENWRLETDIARREMHGDGELTLPFNQSRTIHFFKPQLKGNIGRVTTINGIDFENDNYHLNSLLGVTDDNQQKYSLFSISTIAINPALTLTLGARGAQQNNVLFNFQKTASVNRAFASTLGLSYQIQPGTNFYVRRAESFRFPKADEDASTPIGVKGLKTQRGVSYETGAIWDWKKFTTKLGIYQLNLRDEITFDPFQTPKQPFGANRNLPPTVRKGLNLSEKIILSNQISLDQQYTFVNARFQNGINAGKRIPLISEHIFHGGINFHFIPHWNLYSEAVYTGNQFAANDDANIAGKLGGYTIYNFNLRYHFKEFSATFRVNNIFNKDYYFYSVYQTAVNTQYYYPAPGRNFLLTLKYTFE